MRAMVLAAGLGTRLRPLTNDRPKALVKVSGRTMLEITLFRLREFGINDVIVNAYHFADGLVEYLRTNDNFGLNVEVSPEAILLDTGGGLKQAAHFFAGTTEPFLLHNVDVLSNIDFGSMVQFHLEQNALATLAVQQRTGSRHLLFDGDGELCGRQIKEAPDQLVRPATETMPLGFTGIHVVSPRIFSLLNEEGVFSIIYSYLRLAAAGERIVAFPADQHYWRDLGTQESLAQAERDIAEGAVTI